MKQRVEKKRSIRRGASMIEAVVVIGMSSVILGLGIGTIHLLLNVERETTKSVWHNEVLTRLAVLFRQDVHAANGVRSEQDDLQPLAELELEIPGKGTVAYRVEGHSVTRVRSESGEPQHRDAFHLPLGSKIHFVREQQNGSVRLVVGLPWGAADQTTRQVDDSTRGPATTQDLHFVAVLARDHRFYATDE